jgi:hypothetical protein
MTTSVLPTKVTVEIVPKRAWLTICSSIFYAVAHDVSVCWRLYVQNDACASTSQPLHFNFQVTCLLNASLAARYIHNNYCCSSLVLEKCYWYEPILPHSSDYLVCFDRCSWYLSFHTKNISTYPLQ